MGAKVIAIDGPAGSGKSTVARLVAEKLEMSFLDTGAMYRAVTLAAMEAGVDLSDERSLLAVLDARRFEFSAGDGAMMVRIDGLDVTEAIRGEDVTSNSRYIASAEGVRRRLVEMQRAFAASEGDVVTEGRDQGTVAFSDADVKFYLTAKSCERAHRRAAELLGRGQRVDIEQVQRTIEARDDRDMGRSVGALKQASDAVVVDTTEMSIEEVVDKVVGVVHKRCQ